VISDNGNELKWISGDEATNIKNLEDGVYTLHEEAAPSGYLVATDMIFEIRDGKLISIDNTASIRLFEKNGFKPCGTMHDWMLDSGRWTDAKRYQKIIK
jgi:hypothetical protein